ncbi:Small nuclear ribonucleoprotein E [Spatholobus suberectus]|nr:Small nuclear ribonucleoprotein E [Spatholobus suberectus]
MMIVDVRSSIYDVNIAFAVNYRNLKARILILRFEQKDLRIEGRNIGFDDYMNLVLDDAEKVNIKKKSRKTLGENDEHYVDQLNIGLSVLLILPLVYLHYPDSNLEADDFMIEEVLQKANASYAGYGIVHFDSIHLLVPLFVWVAV